MRQVGTITDEGQAQLFADYLVTRGISAQAEQEDDVWAVWVRDENHVDTAKTEFSAFRDNPRDARYEGASRQAQQLRDEQIERRRQAAKNTVAVREQWNQPLAQRAPLVLALLSACAAIGIVTLLFGESGAYVSAALRFSMFQISRGQVWRLITPILLHGDPLHLAFNMYWLYYLGTQLESRRGSVRMGVIVLTIAIVSNLAQYFVTGPNFVGISGVNYGLFGYIWMKTKFDPRSGFMLRDSTIFILLGFFVLCFVGVFQNVANWAHTGGLITGIAIGYLPIYWKRSQAN